MMLQVRVLQLRQRSMSGFKAECEYKLNIKTKWWILRGGAEKYIAEYYI